MKEVVATISGIDRDIQDVDESIEAFMQESANVLDYSGGMQTRAGELKMLLMKHQCLQRRCKI